MALLEASHSCLCGELNVRNRFKTSRLRKQAFVQARNAFDRDKREIWICVELWIGVPCRPLMVRRGTVVRRSGSNA